VWSTNPLGQPAILTLQAPKGYIRINRQQYIDTIRAQFNALQLTGSPKTWNSKLVKFMNASAELCADIIAETAPIDTGNLAGSMKAAKVGDPSLQGTPNAFGPTELDIGSSWQ